VKYLRSLGQKKVRASEGRLLVEGLNGVEAAVACGAAEELFLSDEVSASGRGRELARGSVPVSRIEERDIEALSETRNPLGAFALARDPVIALGDRDWPATATLLLADGVADPGNLGTMVRSAAALGCDAVVATAGTVEPTNPKVVRATAGALFRIPIVRASRAEVHAAGFELWIADRGGEPIEAVATRPARIALLVGNEPRGVDDAARMAAGRTVAVPIAAGVESLNVAVAAGILLHALRALPIGR
jgi:TrmH family RNA methyltransferase